MKRPNLDFSPADSRQRPAPSLASLTRTPIFGPHRVAFRMLQDQVDFFVVLDHRNDGAAEFGGDDHRLDVAVVLEAVADHDAVGRILGDGHDGKQFGLGSDLQSEAEFLAVAVDLLDDQALLVDLDGEYRGVAVAVVVLRDGVAERLREVAKAVRQDVGEANDHRRVQVACLQSLHDLVQVDLAAQGPCSAGSRRGLGR